MPRLGSSSLSQQRFDAPIPTKHTERTSFGELLRSARDRRGLSLEQIATETKIPLRHLRALEHENLAMMPGLFYGRAEVRAYAQAVHLDQILVLAAFDRALQAEAGDAGPVPHPRQPTSRKYIPLALALVATSLVAAFATFARSTPGQAQQETPPSPQQQAAGQEPTSAQLPGGSAPAQQSPAASLPSPNSPVETATQAPVETTTQAEDQAAQTSTTALGDTGLTVTSEPPGARVTVDGIGWGETPVSIRHLTAGTKRIRITKEGYHSEERLAPVVSGRSGSLHIPMQSAP